MWFVLTTIKHLCPINSEAGSIDCKISAKLNDETTAVEGSREGVASLNTAEHFTEGSIGNLHIVVTTIRMRLYVQTC